jgi:hypothetical protein
MEISTEKTKILTSQEEYPNCSKICVYNKTGKQNSFKYLRYCVTYEKEGETTVKIGN